MKIKQRLLFILIFIVSIPIFAIDRFFMPSPYGIASAFTLSSFYLSPTVGIYIPSGAFPPAVSFSNTNYSEETGNFRSRLYNNSIPSSDRNYFRGVSSSMLVAAYGSFSMYRISLNNIFSTYDNSSESYILNGFKGTVYGGSFFKRGGGFQYGISIKKYSGKFYGTSLKEPDYYRNYKDLINYFIEERDKAEPTNISFYTISGSIMMNVYKFLNISLKIGPINNVKIKDLDKKIETGYEGGLTLLLSRNTTIDFSLSLKKQKFFLYDDYYTKPIKLSATHFFSKNSFITMGWISDSEDNKIFTSGSLSTLSAGFGYVLSNKIYIMGSTSISSWNKLSSLNITIAYISFNQR